jgi:hypothetical protein
MARNGSVMARFDAGFGEGRTTYAGTAAALHMASPAATA